MFPAGHADTSCEAIEIDFGLGMLLEPLGGEAVSAEDFQKNGELSFLAVFSGVTCGQGATRLNPPPASAGDIGLPRPRPA